jgi:hypothetical protein
MKKFLLIAVLLLASCAPSLNTAPQSIVLYKANLAELRTYLITQITTASGGEGYGNWEWVSTTADTTRFIARAQYNVVDYVLAVFTLGISLASKGPQTMTCQIVGESEKTSVLCTPAYSLVFDLLDKKFSRAP